MNLKHWKDPFTSVVGLIIIGWTVFDVFMNGKTWIWEGIAGMGMGFALFLMPDKWIKDVLNAVVKKLTGNNDVA
jgi:hypothetical protein